MKVAEHLNYYSEHLELHYRSLVEVQGLAGHIIFHVDVGVGFFDSDGFCCF